MKKIILFMVAVLATGAAWAQLPDYNLDFEYWDASSLESDAQVFADYPAMHQVTYPHRGNLAYGWVAPVKLWRTTDAYSGQYALVINRWYNGARIWALMGNCPHHAYNDSCLLSTTQKIYGLSGYYKYYNDNTSRGKAKLTMTTYKLDTVSGHLLILSKDSLIFTPQGNYTKFDLNTNYTDTAIIPDSFAIRFDITGPYSGNPYSDFLYLDALHIINSPVSTAGNATNKENEQKWHIYPNPTNTVLHIEHPSIQDCTLLMYDASGKRVMEINWHQATQIDISKVPNGIYQIKILTPNGAMNTIGQIAIHH